MASTSSVLVHFLSRFDTSFLPNIEVWWDAQNGRPASSLDENGNAWLWHKSSILCHSLPQDCTTQDKCLLPL